METTNPEENKDILSDYYSGYQQLELASAETHVRKARNTLFVVAIATLLIGLVQLGVADQMDEISLIIVVGVSLIFAGLGFLTNKKTVAAIVLGLVIYIGLWIADVLVLGVEYLVRGILLRGIVIYFLIKGLKHGREAERLRREIQQQK